MDKLCLSEARKVKSSFKDYERSPWRMFGRDLTLRGLLEMALREGTTQTLEYIRREDITAYHKEEASCGNL